MSCPLISAFMEGIEKRVPREPKEKPSFALKLGDLLATGNSWDKANWGGKYWFGLKRANQDHTPTKEVMLKRASMTFQGLLLMLKDGTKGVIEHHPLRLSSEEDFLGSLEGLDDALEFRVSVDRLKNTPESRTRVQQYRTAKKLIQVLEEMWGHLEKENMAAVGDLAAKGVVLTAAPERIYFSHIIQMLEMK